MSQRVTSKEKKKGQLQRGSVLHLSDYLKYSTRPNCCEFGKLLHQMNSQGSRKGNENYDKGGVRLKFQMKSC